jgi:hypothetical protein
MKKLNPYDLYVFGTRLAPLESIKEDTKLGEVSLKLWFARANLLEFTADDSMLPAASKRAANELIKAIDSTISRDFSKIDNEKQITWSESYHVREKVNALGTVLQNDMPGISAYVVMQKGIYKTDDLIVHAEYALLENIRKHLPAQAKVDMQEAGRCLAYELPIACAFHMYRAMEEVMRYYYQVLTGKTFKEAGIKRGWDAYIKALNEAGAENKVTQFLNHVRAEYRNPQTHPDEIIDIQEAYALLGAAVSSINQMILAGEERRAMRPTAVQSA